MHSACAWFDLIGVRIIIYFYAFNLTVWQTAQVCTGLYPHTLQPHLYLVESEVPFKTSAKVLIVNENYYYFFLQIIFNYEYYNNFVLQFFLLFVFSFSSIPVDK